jgi:hypothetical protein
MNPNVSLQSIGRRVLRYILVENLIYWLTGSIAWIPWVYSRWLGIVTMLVFVPFTMVIATLYCLHKIPVESWKKEIWLIIITFVATCAIIDIFFWILWRGHKILEWFLPTTETGIGNVIGYFEMIIFIFITLMIALRFPRLQKTGWGSKLNEIHIFILGVILFFINLYCAITYW